MRFRKGVHYPHPPRGQGRKPYTMSEAALRQRRRNLTKSRLRSDRESWTIKLLIWQACFESGPRPSQRALARQLGVWPSYVYKVQHKALSEGMDALMRHGRCVTATDLEEGRSFTTRVRGQEPSLLAPAPQPAPKEPRALTADESIAENWREAREEQRKNPPRRREPPSSSSVSPRLLPQLADDIW